MSSKKIIALGPKGTNGHEAAKRAAEILGIKKPEIEFVSSNNEVLIRVGKEKCFGVVPVENVLGGFVRDVVTDYWLKQMIAGLPQSLYVIGEIWLPIVHQLLVRPEILGLDEVTAVVSHEQALSQCTSTLASFGITKMVKALSTAEAAQKVAESDECKTMGAIASNVAGEVYGLKPLRTDIGDSKTNATRFHIVGPEMHVSVTDNDRTAVIFELASDNAGALVDALMPAKVEKISLASVGSVALGAPHEYAFYTEFDCAAGSLAGQKIFDVLRILSSKILVLGSYPRGILRMKECKLPKKKIGIVGGYGAYGIYFLKFFEQRGFEVVRCDLGTTLTIDDVLEFAEVIINCVSLENSLEVTKKIAGFATRNQLVIDIASVKAGNAPVLAQSDAESIMIHNMSRPPEGYGWKNIPVAYCPVKLDKWSGWATEFLVELGARVEEVTTDSHDNAMAGDQILPSDVAVAVGMVIRELSLNWTDLVRLATPNARALLGMTARIHAGNPGLYAKIQDLNPRSVDVIDALLSALTVLRKGIVEHDGSVFAREMERNKEYLGPDALAAMQKLLM